MLRHGRVVLLAGALLHRANVLPRQNRVLLYRSNMLRDTEVLRGVLPRFVLPAVRYEMLPGAKIGMELRKVYD